MEDGEKGGWRDSAYKNAKEKLEIVMSINE